MCIYFLYPSSFLVMELISLYSSWGTLALVYVCDIKGLYCVQQSSGIWKLQRKGKDGWCLHRFIQMNKLPWWDWELFLKIQTYRLIFLSGACGSPACALDSATPCKTKPGVSRKACSASTAGTWWHRWVKSSKWQRDSEVELRTERCRKQKMFHVS